MQLPSQSFCSWNRFVLCCPNFLKLREKILLLHINSICLFCLQYLYHLWSLERRGYGSKCALSLGLIWRQLWKLFLQDLPFTWSPSSTWIHWHLQPSSVFCSLVGSVSRVVSHGAITCSSDAQSTEFWSIKSLMVSLGYTTMATILRCYFPFFQLCFKITAVKLTAREGFDKRANPFTSPFGHLSLQQQF